MRFVISFALSLLINALIIFLFGRGIGIMTVKEIPPPPKPITLTLNFINENANEAAAKIDTKIEKTSDSELVKLETFQPKTKESKPISVDLPKSTLPEDIIKKTAKSNAVRRGVTIFGPLSKIPQKEMSERSLQPYSLERDIGTIPKKTAFPKGGMLSTKATIAERTETLKPYRVKNKNPDLLFKNDVKFVRETEINPKRFSYIQRNFEVSNAKEIFKSLQSDYGRILKKTPLSLQPLLVGDVVGELIIHRNGTVSVKVKSSPSSKLSDIFIRNLSKLTFGNRRNEIKINIIVSFKLGSKIE